LQGRGGRRARERGRERRVEPGRPGTSRGGDLARRFARAREQQGCGEKQASHRSSTTTLGERNTGIVPPRGGKSDADGRRGGAAAGGVARMLRARSRVSVAISLRYPDTPGSDGFQPFLQSA